MSDCTTREEIKGEVRRVCDEFGISVIFPNKPIYSDEVYAGYQVEGEKRVSRDSSKHKMLDDYKPQVNAWKKLVEESRRKAYDKEQ